MGRHVTRRREVLYGDNLVTRPSASSIQRSVLGGVGIKGNLSPSLVPTVTFSPTLGITAGRINKLALDIRSFREPLTRAVRTVMSKSIARNFASGGRPSWEPLSSATIDMRAMSGVGGSSPLVATGRLARTASQINIWDITMTSAVIRDLPQSIWYGKVHQGGYEGGSMKALVNKFHGDIKAASQEHTDRLNLALGGHESLAGTGHTATIPARPFLIIQPEDEDEIMMVFIKWLTERVNRSWPASRV